MYIYTCRPATSPAAKTCGAGKSDKKKKKQQKKGKNAKKGNKQKATKSCYDTACASGIGLSTIVSGSHNRSSSGGTIHSGSLTGTGICKQRQQQQQQQQER